MLRELRSSSLGAATILLCEFGHITSLLWISSSINQRAGLISEIPLSFDLKYLVGQFHLFNSQGGVGETGEDEGASLIFDFRSELAVAHEHSPNAGICSRLL